MIWQSIWAMTVFDVAIVAIVALTFVIVLKRRARLSVRPSLFGFLAISFGLFTMAAFYLADLAIMHVLPQFVPTARAMGWMNDLHLNARWLLSFVAVGAICFGLVRISGAAVGLIETMTAREHQLSNAQRLGKIGHWTVDFNTGQAEWSQEMYRLWGIDPTAGPVVIDTILNAVHPDDRDGLIAERDAALTEKRAYRYEYRVIHPDGTIRYVQNEGQPRLDADGRVISVFGVTQDITDRKKFEREIAERNAILQAMFDASPDTVSLWDTQGRFVFVNERLAGMLGKDSSEFVGRTAQDLFGSARHGAVEAMVFEVLRTGEPIREREMERARFPGRWALFNVSPIHDDAGAIEYVLVSTVDITARKRVEADLRDSERRFRATFEQAAVGIAHVATDGRLLRVNRRLCDILKRDEDSLLQRQFRDLIEPDCRESLLAELDRMIRGELGSHACELRAIRRDGTLAWTQLTVSLVGDEAARAEYFVAVVEDIGERKRIEAQQRDLETSLRQAQKMEAIGQLTGGIAHDFNNLLAVIMVNAELLGEAATNRESTDPPTVESILRAARRGADLTHRLLAFSRRQPLQPVPVDVDRLARGMMDLLTRALGEAIEIELVGGAGLWLCNVDPSQLENAILNLAINARDAMPDGGRLTIETSNARFDDEYAAALEDVVVGQYVRLAVSDTGTGMAPEIVDRVFDPFFTTKEVGEGSGLGLSMVYGFVMQSRGHVRIYSELDEGTTVKIYLPRTTQKAPARLEPRARQKEDWRSRGERIMVVEDDPDLRTVAVSILSELGYDVLEAGTGAAALAQLESHRDVDLLITDVILPGGLGGRELADRAQAKFSGLDVLYMSGYTENAIMHQGRLDEGVQLLAKPFGRAELAAKVRDILDRRR